MYLRSVRVVLPKAISRLLVALCLLTNLYAQPLSTTLCAPRGTPYPSNKQQTPLTQALPGSTATAYVPLRIHIIRRSDGSGDLAVPVLNDALAALNRQYLQQNVGVQFYLSGNGPHFIDSDTFYTGQMPMEAAMDSSDVSNALNLYFYSSGEPYSGYAYYPDDGKIQTRVILRLGENFVSSRHLGEVLMSHELGHSFNLIHPFGVWAEGHTDELVTRGVGSNCDRTGDLLCDTPADPYGYPGGSFTGYDANNCTYYAGDVRDANGDLYTPDATNIMSYLILTRTYIALIAFLRGKPIGYGKG